jgi:hypothetical protein
MRRAYAIASEPARVNETLAEGVKHLLSALGDHYVAYYPSLAEITGSPKAALMLGHAMYMTRVVMDKQPDRGGWFWKTSKEWKKVTGLSVREIETARKMLLKSGILQESRRGMPAKLWFRVDLDRLAIRLCQHANTAYRPWSWEDRVLKTLLGKPVMFYAPFAWIADSALAGLYMSSLFGQLRRSLSKGEADNEGWFNSPIQQSLSHLQFGRRMLMNCRAKLVASGMLEEGRESRMQAQLLSRIMLTTLPARISLETNKFHSLSDSDKQGCRNPTNKSCSKRETRVADTAKQELPEPQNNSSPFRATSSAETATHSIYACNTSYQHQHKGLVVGGKEYFHIPRRTTADASLENLIYPDKLLPGEKQTAKQLLHGSHNPQILLDELAGQMRDGHVKNALGYLRTLKIRQQAGTFIPEHAHRIEAERKHRQEILEQRKRMVVEPQEHIATDREHARLRLAELRQSFWGKK